LELAHISPAARQTVLPNSSITDVAALISPQQAAHSKQPVKATPVASPVAFQFPDTEANRAFWKR
jgi:hypothetical protein